MTALFLFALVLLPEPAWAIIPHEYEGFYPHQVAHVFLVIAMAIFVYYVRRAGLTKEKGWRYIAISGALLLAWNVYTFLGHIAELYVPSDSFSQRDDFWRGSMRIDLASMFYYLYKLDNLILAPCLYYFYLGMRALVESNAPEKKTSP